MFDKITKSLVIVAILVVLGIWLSTGIYTVDAEGGEAAVILRFGEYVNTVTDEGIHWHMPSPIERIEKIKMDEAKRIEFGFRTVRGGDTRTAAQYQGIDEQSLMLTGDENIVNVDAAIQYNIKNVEEYLFKVDDQTHTLEIALESSIRRVVANHTLDDVLTVSKSEIQNAIRDDLQGICDDYEMGVFITAVQLQDVEPPGEVDAAFKDVANAREDKNSYINEANGYRNEIVPKARGNAAQMLNEAEAYKEKRVAEAKGDVANFEQILERYQLGKEVTRKRMYLETLEEILPNVEKYIVDGDGNTIKFLPLEQNALTGREGQ